MAGKQACKPRLSKGILEMKFMQRTKEKVKKENDVAEGREMYSDEITERMRTSNSNFIIEPSFVHCADLIEGRLSFRGMNPEIERLLELERQEKAGERQEQSNDVSNEIMAKIYYANKMQAGAALAMDKKFNKFKKVNSGDNRNNQKRQKNGIDQNTEVVQRKKTKFIKPKDSDDEEEDN